MNYLIAFIIAYLYGSIPFSLLVGLIIYKVDIRKVGSGNVGGSNLGRACGKWAFTLGFILDGSKGALAVLLGLIFGVNPVFIVIFALIGHAASIFNHFKGGKGVATAFGFALSYTFIPAIIAITVFLIILKISKYVSLSSILAILAYLVVIFPTQDYYYTGIIFVGWLFIIYKHKTNIKAIKDGTERKITWM